MSGSEANDSSCEQRTLRGVLLSCKAASAVPQCRPDKTDILEDLYISSLADSYVGQETHLHFILALLALLRIL